MATQLCFAAMRIDPDWTEDKQMKKILAVLIACVAVSLAAKPAAEKPPLRFLQDIPLPGLKNGDFDHFAVDLAGKRLFLTGEANNVVLVLDTNSNKLIHTISDVEEPHSMLFLPASKQLWVVAGGEGKIKIFNSDTYEVIDVLNVDEGADSSAYDSAARRFYVITGGGDAKLDYSLIRVFDTDSRKQISEIKIDSKNIEAIALEKKRSTNLREYSRQERCRGNRPRESDSDGHVDAGRASRKHSGCV